jgi:hypothetical protein
MVDHEIHACKKAYFNNKKTRKLVKPTREIFHCLNLKFYLEVCAFFNQNFKMFFYRRSAGPAVDMCGKSLYIDLNELQTYRRDQPQPIPKGNLLKAIDNKTAQIFCIANF